MTVLTGSSGSGKSSLLALLLRFTEPTSGRIRVGTQPLHDLPVADWRKQIAWVPQAPYLFAGTVRDNIRLGSPSATEGEVWDAVERAGAGDFVGRLPRALETRIGERGLRLSAGQRQRVALARAFLRDAPLLLLDEPTAHLDPISAGALRGSVERLMAGRTVLLVTHHRTWLDQADTVLSLVEGRVVPATLEVVM
jgi:ATP-binding cassette subfamily C protein CydD